MPNQRVPDLLAGLIDPDSAMRCSAAAALGQLGEEEACPLLFLLLQDPDLAVRRAAARALAAINPSMLASALAHEIRDARLVALFALGPEHMDGLDADPVILALEGVIRDPAQTVREHAARLLGSMRGATAAVALASLMADPIASIRYVVVCRIRQVHHNAAHPVLLAALRDPDAAVRAAAVAELGQLGTIDVVVPLIDALSVEKSSAPVVRNEIATVLGSLGDLRAFVPLLCAPETATYAPRFCDALVRISGPHLGDLLIDALMNSNVSVAVAAARAIGHLGLKQAKPALFEIVRNERGPRMHAAARALGEMRDSQVIELILDRLAEPDLDIYSTAIEVLPAFGGDRVVRALSGLLTQASMDLRMAAVGALLRCPGAETTSVLLSVVHEFPGLIVAPLCERREPQVAAYICTLVHQRSAWLRPKALLTLGALGGKEAVEALRLALAQRKEFKFSVGPAAAHALGQLKDTDSVPLLCQALQEACAQSEQGLIGEVLFALRRLGGNMAAQMIDSIAASLPEPLRIAGYLALCDLATPAEITTLVSLMRHPQRCLYRAASRALVRMGPAVAPQMESLLEDLDPQVRRRAAWVLGKTDNRDCCQARLALENRTYAKVVLS